MDAKIEIQKRVGLNVPDYELFEPGEFGAVLEIEVRDKDGNIKEQWKKKSESFTRQFFDLLLVQALNASDMYPLQITDITGALRDIAMHNQNFQANGGVGDTNNGIVAGTGHGSAIGQLQYGGMTFGLPTSNLTTSIFTLTRVLSNASGSAITVYELGVYVNGYGARPDAGQLRGLFRFMTIRDVIGIGIVIQNGESLTVNYRFQGVV
jgi:hypothetical protein